jgi:hypothetical protein
MAREPLRLKRLFTPQSFDNPDLRLYKKPSEFERRLFVLSNAEGDP